MFRKYLIEPIELIYQFSLTQQVSGHECLLIITYN